MSIEPKKVFDDGGRILLRELVPGDITDNYLKWFENGTVTQFLDSKNISRIDAINYMEHGRKSRSYFMYAIVDKVSHSHIGNVKIGPVKWDHGLADLVTVIGRHESWGKGIGSEAIALGTKVAFEVYDIRKLSGGIADGNVGSVKAYTRAGWVVEARLKGHHLIDGDPRDRIVVSCFNPRHFPGEEIG